MRKGRKSEAVILKPRGRTWTRRKKDGWIKKERRKEKKKKRGRW